MSVQRSACYEENTAKNAVKRAAVVAASRSMEWTSQLAQMDAKSLRALTTTLLAQLAEQESQLASRDKELKTKQLKIDQLTYEMAILKRWRYDRKSERCTGSICSLRRSKR